MSDASITREKKTAGGKREPAEWEYSTEVVSPVLGYGDIADLQEVVRQLRHSGAIVNASCGIHIHVDARNAEKPGEPYGTEGGHPLQKPEDSAGASALLQKGQ